MNKETNHLATICSLVFSLALFVTLPAAAQGSITEQSDAALQGPAAQSGVESGQAVQLEGELEITYQDFSDGHARLEHTLKLSDGTRVPLQFVNEPPRHFLTGDHVRAHGRLSNGSLILYSGGASPAGDTSGGSTTSSIPVPNTFGPQSTLVILVNFEDDAVEPYAVTAVQSAFFTKANSFVMENSYGQTSLTGNTVGWYTIPDSVTTCNISQISTDANNAAVATGAKLSNYTRLVYFFPSDSVCGFSGASTVGGNPSQSWINGTLDPYVLDHELGHAFGLWHSHLDDCGATATICSNGTIVEYGDLLDTMGTPQGASPDYNAYQKEQLGWLNYGASPSIQTVTSSGTYTINPYEPTGPGPKALKVLKSTDPTTDAKTWYYLEARQAVGFDAFLSNPQFWPENETTGVLFHTGTDGNSNTSDLLDMTPATPTYDGWYDPSLVVGQSFQDSTAAVTFTPTAVSSSGATVEITMNGNGPACTAANPTVSVSPSQSQNVTSGTAVNFTVSVKDNDNSSCSTATFDLSDALPSGWAGVWSTTALSLSPGKSGSATATVTSPLGTADGSYNAGVSATNISASSYKGSATATYVISTPAPLSISLTTNQSSYLPGQTVAISVSLLSGTSPDAGASVTVTVTSPGGKATTLKGATGSNGVALVNYKLSKGAAAGTYQVQAATTVTGSGPTAGQSATFTVQ